MSPPAVTWKSRASRSPWSSSSCWRVPSPWRGRDRRRARRQIVGSMASVTLSRLTWPESWRGRRGGRGGSFSTDRWDLVSSWCLAVVVSWTALNSKYQTWDVLVLSRTRLVRRWLVEAGGVEVLGGLHAAGCLGWNCPKELGTWSEDAWLWRLQGAGDEAWCRSLDSRRATAAWVRLSDCISLGVSTGRRGGTRHFTGPGPSFRLGTIPQWPLGPGHLSAHRPRVTPGLCLVSTPLAPPLPWLSPGSQTMRCASSWSQPLATDIFSIRPRPHPRHYTAHFKTLMFITRKNSDASPGAFTWLCY